MYQVHVKEINKEIQDEKVLSHSKLFPDSGLVLKSDTKKVFSLNTHPPPRFLTYS